MSSGKHWEQDKEATVYIGNLDERVTDSLVWELMLQAGRIVNVHLPKDRVTQTHQGYGFVEFISEEDAEYAARIMNQIRLYGKPIRVNKASADKQRSAEIGAELFIGNLDAIVSEQNLLETFSRFGTLLSQPKVARDENGLSKGYGFVSFASFESSDDAIANLHGQYLMNKEVSVQYAYKKDGKGERHGDQAERMLAAQARAHNVHPSAQGHMGNFAPHLAPVMQGGVNDSDTGTTASSGAAHFNTGGPNGPMPGYAGSIPVSHGAGAAHPRPPSNLPARPPPSQVGYARPNAGSFPPGFDTSVMSSATRFSQTPNGHNLPTAPTGPGTFLHSR